MTVIQLISQLVSAVERNHCSLNTPVKYPDMGYGDYVDCVIKVHPDVIHINMDPQVQHALESELGPMPTDYKEPEYLGHDDAAFYAERNLEDERSC